MIASKVEVNPDLIKFKPLSRKKKAALREQRIIELIESRPFMSRIKGEDFAVVTEMSTQNTWNMINRMVKKHKIVKHSLTLRTFAFTVESKSNIVKPANPPIEVRANTASTGGGTAQLATYAKEFAWSTNSDSLREFVAYMDGKELDLRRLADV